MKNYLDIEQITFIENLWKNESKKAPQIAKELGLSVWTVRHQIQRLKKKALILKRWVALLKGLGLVFP